MGIVLPSDKAQQQTFNRPHNKALLKERNQLKDALQQFVDIMASCGDWPDTRAELVPLSQLAKEARGLLKE